MGFYVCRIASDFVSHNIHYVILQKKICTQNVNSTSLMNNEIK